MDIVTKVLAEMARHTEKGRQLAARSVSGHIFDVQSRPGVDASRIVDLEKRECTCMKFQDLGYQCKHACAAALLADLDIPSLCIDERRVGALRRVYEFGIIPIDLETIPLILSERPPVQRQAGRPKVKRIRRRDEDRPKKIRFCALIGKQGMTRRHVG